MTSKKIEKVKDLRNLSEQELKSKQELLYQEIFKLNQQRYAGRVEKPHLFKQVNKDVARIKTILAEKSSEKNDQKTA